MGSVQEETPLVATLTAFAEHRAGNEMNAILALVAAVGLTARTAPHQRDDASRIEGLDATERQIRRLAERIRSDVVAGRGDAILALLLPEGMACGDDMIPKERFERELKDKGSFLHAVLFDSSALRDRFSECGVTMSLQEKFRRNRKGPIAVMFAPSATRSPWAFPCAKFLMGASEGDESICFVKVNNRWWLADAFYDCG